MAASGKACTNLVPSSTSMGLSVSKTWCLALQVSAYLALALGCQTEQSPAEQRPSLDAEADSIAPFDAVAPSSDSIPHFPDLTPAEGRSEFVGSAACQRCHPAEYDTWAKSTHGMAGGSATESILLPRGDERAFSFSDVSVRLIPHKGGFGFRLALYPGQSSPPVMSIDGVVGRDLMVGGGGQAFFHRRSDGLIMHLPFEFNRAERAWFCQKRGESLSAGQGRMDYQWTRIDGSFPLADCQWPTKRSLGFTNTMNCANCHASQVEVEYRRRDARFETSVASFSINCESCHGPAGRHVEMMETGGQQSEDIGLVDLSLLDKFDSVRVCASCHVSKRLTRSGYRAGDDFDRYFSTLTMGDPARRVVHFDGRIADFGYQEGHLYSPCYLDGSMTCVDCHDPHGQSYRDVHGMVLTGRFDDGQCTGCHAAKLGSTHGKHPDVKDAPGCVACHMPYHQHPAVPKQFKLARSDHAIPIPRPGVDEAQGVTNACQGCHSSTGLEWQKRTIQQLYGTIKPRPLCSIGYLSWLRFGTRDYPIADRVWKSHSMTPS